MDLQAERNTLELAQWQLYDIADDLNKVSRKKLRDQALALAEELEVAVADIDYEIGEAEEEENK